MGGHTARQSLRWVNTDTLQRKYVLVAGVGNTSMCEDLATDGLATVGCDYSDHVIKLCKGDVRENLSRLVEYILRYDQYLSI